MARLARAFPINRMYRRPVLGAVVVVAPVSRTVLSFTHARHVQPKFRFYRLPVLKARRRWAQVI